VLSTADSSSIIKVVTHKLLSILSYISKAEIIFFYNICLSQSLREHTVCGIAYRLRIENVFKIIRTKNYARLLLADRLRLQNV